MSLVTWVNGKKTYIVSIIAILYIVSQALIHAITWETAVPEIMAALSAMTIRHGISTATTDSADGSK